ncbi:MAG: asparaginase [Pseudomonadota bacterium]
MNVNSPKVVVLGTGGTIVGVGAGPHALSYQAAQLGVAQVVDHVQSVAPDLAAMAIECRQVAQVDSKDMDWPIWQAIGRALQAELSRPDVGAIVITHGTDTLEETAFLLHCLLNADKPVVLTAAMRPATSHEADGPGNLRDALRVAHAAALHQQHGVVVVMAGQVWPARAVRKVQTLQIDAFDGGGCEALALVHASGEIEEFGAWPAGGHGGWACLEQDRPARVEIVTSHAGADGRLVDAMLAFQPQTDPVKGLVVAGTGHGTIHQGLTQALQRAEQSGIKVLRSTRVARGGVERRDEDQWPTAGTLTPAQARVALMLELMGVPSAG